MAIIVSVHLFKETKTFNLFQKSCHSFASWVFLSCFRGSAVGKDWVSGLLREGEAGMLRASPGRLRRVHCPSRSLTPAVSHHSLESLCT